MTAIWHPLQGFERPKLARLRPIDIVARAKKRPQSIRHREGTSGDEVYRSPFSAMLVVSPPATMM
jgi:hypothetical protein